MSGVDCHASTRDIQLAAIAASVPIAAITGIKVAAVATGDHAVAFANVAVIFDGPLAIDAAIRAVVDAESWEEVRADAEKIATGSAAPFGPLWQDPAKDRFTAEWDNALQAWKTDETDWSFWITWATPLRNGTPQNQQFLTKIATQENAFWQGTAPEINARFAAIAEKYVLLA